MKKKKQSSITKESTAMEIDLKTLIRDNADFFDKLVELIPARFYIPTDNDDKPWFQGLSKAAKAEAKLKSIENTKKARRDRLDPSKSSKTTLDILKESLQNGKIDNKSSSSGKLGFHDDGDEEEEKEEDGDVDDDKKPRSVTYEELRQRLRRRIEDLRGGRGESSVREGKRVERREKMEERKRKRSSSEGEENDDEAKKKKRENERNVVEKEVLAAANDIEFGKVKLRAGTDDVSFDKKKKKKKLSKEKELERARKLEEAMKDPEKGQIVAKKHSWKAATERAMGIKVHDNPKLLKQSMDKDKRKHKKSVEKWKQRVETTEKMKHEKQGKRKENIKAKIDRRKQKKIEKREKKLMRPGFEGRKEGFVTGN